MPFLLLLLLAFVLPAQAQQTIPLDGEWQFAIDRSRDGVRPKRYSETISLPGSMLTNGKGDPVSIHTQWTGSLYDSSYYFNPRMEVYRREGNMKFPFFLTPERQYVGHAWYCRKVMVPQQWKGRRVTLFLERPHIETTLWVNGRRVGHEMSLSVPHQYDITDYVTFGSDNQLEIQVYNGIENVCVGQDSHSVTDQTQGNWNGIVGRIELRATPPLYCKRVETDIATGNVRIMLNDTVISRQMPTPVRLWSEHTPELYTIEVEYRGEQIPVTFGFRDIRTEGRYLMLNGDEIWLRGTVENCCFPETGYPPTDVETWVSIFETCREYGLNHVRFHSYCPPEAAFTAADQVGIYLQPEGPSWPNHGVRLRRGMTIDQYLVDECKRIVDTYGSHPSFVMLAGGNEPAGDWVAWGKDFTREMRAYDASRLYATASVGGGWAWDEGSDFHVKGGARGLEWDRAMPQSTDDYLDQVLQPRNFKPTDTQPENNEPYISHEQGQWCAFPDLSEINQYTGAYKARNFEIFADLLRQGGMESQAKNFLHASCRLQDLAYKYEMERNLRTPDYAGFQLLSLNDYSGQGTALVGRLNVHWQEKADKRPAAQWRTFCSDLVPMACLPRFVYSRADTLRADIDIYNATGKIIGPIGLDDQLPYVTFDLDGNQWAYDPQRNINRLQRVHHHGTLYTGVIPKGKNHHIGKLELPLSTIASGDAPMRLTLTLTIHTNNEEYPETQKLNNSITQKLKNLETQKLNTYDIWIYPQKLTTSTEGILITETLDDAAMECLKHGGKVLLCAGGKIKYGNDVRHTYLPVFWNTSWFKMRPPHTTGAYIYNEHPIFTDFPTDDWQNLNWWELVNRTQVMNLAEFPAEFQPIVQPIDTWHVSRKLGMLFEARVNGGSLIMTTFDLGRDLDHRLVARQLRHSILRYMQSDAFHPTTIIQPETITHLFTEEAPRVDMFTNDSPDELKPKITSP